MKVLLDIRYAVRQLRKAPAFALTAIFTLAAGIAATTVVFSIVNAVLLRPLPFPGADRLMAIDSLESARGGAKTGATVVSQDISYPNFYDWRSQSKSFESMTSYQTSGFTLASHDGGPSTRLVGALVSSDLFDTLGTKPVLGRGFRRDEEQAGHRSVVISNAIWQSQFGGATNAIGRQIRLNEEDYTVIGVVDRGFQFPISATSVEVWVTQAHNAEGTNASANQRGWTQISVVGKLREGISREAAEAEMSTIQQRLAAQYPDNNASLAGAKIVPLVSELVGDVSKPLRILFAAVSFLLLIACANVAGLLLTRANGRRSEVSIRSALGAGRGQILRQVMMESLTLACAGGVLGLALAAVVLKLAPFYLPENLPRVHDVAIDGKVAAFSIALSLLTGVVFGVFPAWRLSRLDPAAALRDGSRGMTASKGQNRLQSGLVIAETAVGLILLVGAGLLLRSFDRILHVDPGFTPEQLLTFRIAVPQSRYTDEQRVLFFNTLLPQLEGMQGVKSASAAFPLPLTGGDIRISFSIVGQKTAPGDEPSERLTLVHAKFFETMRIPLRQGHFFTAADHRATAPQVVIVNESFARKYFPGKTAVGERVQTNVGLGDGPTIREVVGVVGDVKRSALTEGNAPEYYLPIEQGPIAPPAVALRVVGDPLRYEAQVRALVGKIDSSLPVYGVKTYREELARLTAQQRFEAILLSAFAGVAMLLSAVGLYGVLSYAVSQRTKEIGLRMALGAQRETVQRHFLRQGLVLCGIGLALGGGLSALLTRYIASLLFGVGPFDLVTFAGMTLLLFAVSCIASLVPAYRASQLDPMQALRAE